MAHEVMIEQLGKRAVKKDAPYAACEKGSLGMKKSRMRSMDPDARQRLLMAASSRT